MEISDKLKEHFIAINPARLHNTLKYEDMIFEDEEKAILDKNLCIVYLGRNLKDEIKSESGFYFPNPALKEKNVKLFLEKLTQAIASKGKLGIITRDSYTFPKRALANAKVFSSEFYTSNSHFGGVLRSIIAEAGRKYRSNNLFN